MLAVAVEHDNDVVAELLCPGKASHHRMGLADVLRHHNDIGTGEAGNLGGLIS